MSNLNQKLAGIARTTLLGAAAIGCAAAPVLAHDMPPAGHAGQCFAEVTYPATYRSVSERVPGSPKVSYRTIPAVMGHGTRQVMVKPASFTREVIPAVYKTVPRWTTVAGPRRWAHTAPVYRVVSERRLVEPEHLVWRRTTSRRGFAGGDAYGTRVQPTGEVLCRVLIPARYVWTSHRVMVSSGHAYQIPGRARQVVCYVKMLVTPARVIKHPIEAVYKTVPTTYVVTPAKRERVETPGPDRTVWHKVQVAPAHKGWKQIGCHKVAHHRPVYHRPVHHHRAPCPVICRQPRFEPSDPSS